MNTPVISGPHPTPAILIVEDDDRLREGLVDVLRTRRVPVTAVSTLSQGIEHLDRSPPRCLILDLILKDGRGTEILRHVRAKQLPTRVAITTGTNDYILLEAVRRLRPDTIFHKPYGVRDLVAWLSIALPLPQLPLAS